LSIARDNGLMQIRVARLEVWYVQPVLRRPVGVDAQQAVGHQSDMPSPREE
jgi:hypothetical protein